MKKNIRIAGYCALLILWTALTLASWFSPAKELSLSERRPLQQMPTFSADSLVSGSFMEKFGDYALDQFPLRDAFRTVKSLFSYKVLGQKDNNGIYVEDGYAAKLEYPVNDASVSYALKKFNYIYEQYLKDSGCGVYMSIVPDKGYYLARENGYPAMDYAAFFSRAAEATPWAEQVDLTKVLQLADYYRTDTHWRQECLLPVAQALCSAMDATQPRLEDFTKVLASQQFYGVYYGQAALPMEAEELYVMESPLLKDCRVYNHETKAYQPVYDPEKLEGLDPYDVYLSGPQALLTVENPHAATDKELIIFRDSYGSSLAPLLMQGYRMVTLVDIRYISSAILGDYLTFAGQDVLLLYSTLILNNSTSLK